MTNSTNSLVAGAVAGVIARTIVCPLDVLKLRLQVPESSHLSFLAELSRLPLKSLWRGNVAGVVLYAAYSSSQFGIYSTLKWDSVFLRAAGAALGATALTYPFDVLRTRMTLSKHSKSLYSCIREIWCKEGPIVFYKGFSLSVAQVVPYMGSVFALHSQLKRYTSDFWAGALSGFACKTVFMPVDVLRKRLQLLHLNQADFSVPALSPARNVKELCVRMWRVEGGLRPFFRGWTMAVSKAAPVTGITFFVYNQVMRVLE